MLGLVLVAPLVFIAGRGEPVPARAAETTISVDALRTGWDQNESALAPTTVGGGSFSQLFSTAVDGQVYAQPVVFNGTVLVATENDVIYGIDAASGAIRWQRSLGTPWPAAAVGCGDLTPNIGVTSTPVVDPATGIAYLFAKSYDGVDPHTARYQAHAITMTTGAEVSGWPVTIAGAAANFSAASFDPYLGLQRTGLLLLDGVVYAGFSAHCGQTPSRGWVAGVSASRAQLTTLWTSQATATGSEGNIWQSGGGLVSDGSGQIVLQTDDGTLPAAGPGTTPPANLAESVVRLAVQTNGSLRATDFFSPWNADTLNSLGKDLGSGGPAALPSGFGTSSHPKLMVTAGKEGRVYLFDRASLGGRAQGSGGSDLVLGEFGPYDGVWGHPAVWGGDGGWVYLQGVGPLRAFAYSVDSSGKPTLTLTGTSSDAFGFGSGSPVVSSNGTASGSALVWVVYEPDASGNNAELRAYDAVPTSFTMRLRWKAPIGQAAKFSVPALDGGRVYVGTRDGHLLAFGNQTASPPTVSPSSLTFGNVAVGATASQTVTLTATAATTVSSTSISGGPYAVTSTSAPLPQTLNAGQTLSVTVTFSPTAVGSAAGTLTVTTSQGNIGVSLQGSGAFAGPHVSASPPAVDFGTVLVGRSQSGSVTFVNDGTAAVSVSNASPPTAPFSATGLPASGTTLAPGAIVAVALSFAPTAAGSFSSTVGLVTSAGNPSAALSGTGTTNAGHLTLTPSNLDFGSVGVGSTASSSFDVGNSGGVPITITLAKAPAGVFSTTTPLAEGTVIGPGGHITQAVQFTPNAVGPATGSYLISSDDGQGQLTESLSGTGTSVGSPTITIVNPLSNATVSGTIAVQASAANAQSVGYAVDGGAETAMAFNAATGLWAASLDTTKLSNALHNVDVLNHGANGTTVSDRAWNVLVSNTSPAATSTPTLTSTPIATGNPTITIVNPLSNATVSGTIAVQASAANAQSVGYAVDGGAETAMAFNAATGLWAASLDTTKLSNATHNVDVLNHGANGTTVSDRAWNVLVSNTSPTPTSTSGTPTATSTATVTGPPTITIVNPLSNATVSGTIAVQASAANAQSVGYAVDGGAETAMAFNAATGLWAASLDTTKLSNATHNVDVLNHGANGTTVSDRAWNVLVSNTGLPPTSTPTPTTPPSTTPSPTPTRSSTPTPTITPTVTPTAAPQTVQIVRPVAGSTNSGNFVVQVSAPGATTASYSVDGEGSTLMAYNTNTGYWEARLNSRKLTNGIHTVEATATGPGGTAKASTSFTVIN